jgi:translocator protein
MARRPLVKGSCTMHMPIMSITIVVAVAITVLLLGAGAWATKIDNWYRELRKPSWTPPSWVFAPAWTAILGLACASGVMAWSSSAPELRWKVGVAFGANAVLHLLWSPIFFRLRRPDVAFVEVIGLWASIVAMILVVRPASPVSAWLLAPYLAWVSYAMAINLAIVRLNDGAENHLSKTTIAP